MHNHYERSLKETKPAPTIKTLVALTLNSKDASVGRMIRDGAEAVVKVHVMEAVASYVSVLHPSRGVSVESIVTMVDYFVNNDDVKQLKPVDLKTFFDLAFKRQKYGKLYGGFGYDTLLEWLNLFLDERMEEVINYREQQHQSFTTFEKQRRTREEGDAFGINSLLQSYEQTEQDGTPDAHDSQERNPSSADS